MAEDIFGRANTNTKGVFVSAQAKIVFSGESSSALNAMLIARLQSSYAQNIQRIYELGSNHAYFVIGQPQGQGSIGAVFGPKAVVGANYQKLADPSVKKNIEFKSDGAATCVPGTSGGVAQSGAGWTRSLQDVMLSSVDFSVEARDMLINENMGFMFSAMSLTAA
jgi:hypothetical protein